MFLFLPLLVPLVILLQLCTYIVNTAKKAKKGKDKDKDSKDSKDSKEKKREKKVAMFVAIYIGIRPSHSFVTNHYEIVVVAIDDPGSIRGSNTWYVLKEYYTCINERP